MRPIVSMLALVTIVSFVGWLPLGQAQTCVQDNKDCVCVDNCPNNDGKNCAATFGWTNESVTGYGCQYAVAVFKLTTDGL
jgi:hypothetical protein